LIKFCRTLIKSAQQIALNHLDDFLLIAQRLKIKGLINEDVEEVGNKIQAVTSG
jgi:hypothetical protein